MNYHWFTPLGPSMQYDIFFNFASCTVWPFSIGWWCWWSLAWKDGSQESSSLYHGLNYPSKEQSRKEYQEYLQEKLSQDDAAQAEKRKLEDCDEMESKCSTQLRTTKQCQDFLTNQSSLRSYFHSNRIVHQETGTLKRKSGQREKSGSISKNCWSTRMDHWSSVPNVESTSHVDLPRPAMEA